MFMIEWRSKIPDAKGRYSLKSADTMDVNAKSMEALEYNFSRLREAGKSLTVGNVINHFSEVEKANGSETDNGIMKKRFRGFTIFSVSSSEYGWKVELVKKCSTLPETAVMKSEEC